MADFLATNEFAGTGAVMQVEVNFAGVRVDLPNQPAPYLEADDVKAAIVTPATNTTVEVVTPITLTQINALTFRTTVVVPVGQTLRVYRSTDIEYPIVDFVSLQVVTESDLDSQARQTLYAVMEAEDNAQIAIRTAGGASDTATQAFVLAENAVETADAATVTANQAAADATQAVATANSADSKANQALANAAAAEEHAEAVEVLAQQAGDDADAAAQSAADANTAANTAITTANGIDAKAQSALDASAAATTTANRAAATANGIAATANQANATANSANATAGQALTTANAAQASVDAALTGKQDHADRLDYIVQLPATGGMYSVMALNGGGAVTKLVTSPFVGDTLLQAASGVAFRNAIGVGPAQAVGFGDIASSGNITAAGYVAANTMGTVTGASVNFTGGIVAAGTLRSNSDVFTKQQLTVSAIGTANAHVWFRDGDESTERALLYADSAHNLHIRANGGSGGEGVTINPANYTTINGLDVANNTTRQTTFFRSGVPLDANTYGSCQLQLQAADGSYPALGFHMAGRVASAIALNTDNNFYVAKNDGNVHLLLTTQTIMGQLAPLFTADVPGSFGFFNVTTGTNLGPNGVIGGGSLKWSSHNSILNQTVNGSWRCLGYGNNGGSSLWVRYA